MAKADHEHWRQLEREARKQAYVGKAHARAEQDRFSEAGIERLYAAVCDVIVESGTLAVLDALYVRMHHYVEEQKPPGEQLMADVREICERASRGN